MKFISEKKTQIWNSKLNKVDAEFKRVEIITETKKGKEIFKHIEYKYELETDDFKLAKRLVDLGFEYDPEEFENLKGK